MILANTIIDKIEKEKGSSITFDFDIRYLQRWCKEFPQCFPKFILKGNFEPIFNWAKMRWEIYKIGDKKIKTINI
jgi:hypothetical protein